MEDVNSEQVGRFSQRNIENQSHWCSRGRFHTHSNAQEIATSLNSSHILFHHRSKSCYLLGSREPSLFADRCHHAKGRYQASLLFCLTKNTAC